MARGVDAGAILQRLEDGDQLLFAQHATVDEDLLERERTARAPKRVLDARLADQAQFDQQRTERLPLLETRLDSKRSCELLGRQDAVGDEDVSDRQFRVRPGC